jgi:hypothetical protein
MAEEEHLFKEGRLPAPPAGYPAHALSAAININPIETDEPRGWGLGEHLQRRVPCHGRVRSAAFERPTNTVAGSRCIHPCWATLVFPTQWVPCAFAVGIRYSGIVDGNVTIPHLYFKTVHESFQLTRLLAGMIVILASDTFTVGSRCSSEYHY